MVYAIKLMSFDRTCEQNADENIMAGIKMKISYMEESTKRKRRESNSWTSVDVLNWDVDVPYFVNNLHIITVRLTFLAHSVRMRPNFQGLPWFELDGLVEVELLIRFLLN